MGYILDSTTIRAPYRFTERNNTQMAQQRPLDGSITRDYFGSNKRVWTFEYVNCKKSDYDTLNTIYQSYLSTGTGKTLQITETNYAVSTITVHVDLLVRNFSVRGTDYISDFTLILTEA